MKRSLPGWREKKRYQEWCLKLCMVWIIRKPVAVKLRVQPCRKLIQMKSWFLGGLVWSQRCDQYTLLKTSRVYCLKQGGQVGVVVSFLAFHLWDPDLNPVVGNYVDWVFSPYLTAWVLPGINLWVFPPTSKTETSFFLIFSPLGSWHVQWFSSLFWESLASQSELMKWKKKPSRPHRFFSELYLQVYYYNFS